MPPNRDKHADVLSRILSLDRAGNARNGLRRIGLAAGTLLEAIPLLQHMVLGLPEPACRLARTAQSMARRRRLACADPSELVHSLPQEFHVEASEWLRERGLHECSANKSSGPRPIGSIAYYIDGSSRFPGNTGIQRVVRQLARALMAAGHELVPVVWDREEHCLCLASTVDLAHLALWNGPAIHHWSMRPDLGSTSNTAWFLVAELLVEHSEQDRVRLLAEIKARGYMTCAIFIDAIPLKMRDLYHAHFIEQVHQYWLWLGTVNVVLPISKYAACDLYALLRSEGIAPNELRQKLHPVQLPGEFSTERRKATGVRNPEQPVRILSVGTIEARKNHLALVAALTDAARRVSRNVELVLAGRRESPELADCLVRMISGNRAITWVEDITDERLRELYDNSDFTVYPSVEEGFGLPILESLWFGKPCICANFGAMREVAHEGGCFMVDVTNREALAEAIARLTDDDAFRNSLAHEAANRSLTLWSDYASEIANRLSTVECKVESAS